MASQVIEKVSKAEFCRQAGFSSVRLKGLISAGLPLTRDRKVPLKRALAWIEQNVDPARRNNWSPTLHENMKCKPPHEGRPRSKAVSSRDETGQPETLPPPSLNDFRRQREAQKVAAGEIELAKARGELVERAAVRKFLADRARLERDQWISWASAAAGRLAGPLGVDAGRLFAAIEAEVRDQLRSLSSKPLEPEQ